MSDTQTNTAAASATQVKLPRVAITYCTQCRWMLRAAYFGQELLSTFGTAIGEIALIPATGGLFTVGLSYRPSEVAGAEEGADSTVQDVLLWDRKAEGGFPETKVLKQRVRDHLEPKRNLGHSDVHGKQGAKKPEEPKEKPDETKSEEKKEQKASGEGEGEVKRNPDGSKRRRSLSASTRNTD
ncbi:Rdx family-domain-containing protein [Phyllosticta citrichinensis]|uniref:Rdx family-domain-containing protein n=1 Tax=Phyllosticta citrichinensis TaxID=1130410 RepID=A0ABR1XMS7_9PEZI